jgi:uncharacterized protein
LKAPARSHGLVHPEAPRVAVESFEFSRSHAGRDVVIRGDVYLAVDAQDGVVFCHGFKGFGRWGFYPYLAPHVAARGFNAVTFDFSGSGVGADRETYTQREEFARNTYTQELADIDAVVSYARDRGWIGGRYGVFGHSRGGGDAILHAARSGDTGALVTWAATAHVLRWMPYETDRWHERGYIDIVNARTGDVLPLGVTLLDECERLHTTELNIERAAASLRIPWLLVHGSADESVTIDDAYRLNAAARGAPDLTLEIIEGGNHVFGAAHPLGEVPQPLRELTERTAGFFAEHLRRD